MRSRTNQVGFTLVELLVATTLSLIMMAAVVQIFRSIGESVSNTRGMLEISSRLRSTRTRLKMDLAGITVTMRPPRRPEAAEGYFQYIEGPVGPIIPSTTLAKNKDDPTNIIPDTTVGDFDDILMFTTHSTSGPFIGRCAVTGGTIESDVAEVVWFVRGRTLYRRVLLVAPGVNLSGVASTAGFFAENDISVRSESDKPVANSLGDLTKRECRYAHDVTNGANSFPFDARGWGQLGLPTLRECSHPNWNAGAMAPIPATPVAAEIDFWNNPHPWNNVDQVTGTLVGYEGPRIAEDVILTNVIGFDVKAWDPGAPVMPAGDAILVPGDPGYQPDALTAVSFGAYADLGYDPRYAAPANSPQPHFHHTGEPRSGLKATGAQAACVYDTWSFHYEHDGIGADQGTNGFDDDLPGEPGYGIVDDPGEMETSPPYPVPLRAIQVKIRLYEPDSRQIREVTITQNFLPK